MKLKLHIVICSTRPGRSGPSVARWFRSAAQTDDRFDCALIDLEDFALPLYNEAQHPRLRQYEHAHTLRWAQSVSSADAFVFVTPEYNYAPPPSLLNALDYLSVEWNYKPAAFVSYGGIGAGVRAVQVAKQVITTLKMIPILDAIPIPNFRTQFAADGSFTANEGQHKAVAPMLDDLHRVSLALRPLRDHGHVAATPEELLSAERQRCAALVAKDMSALEAILAQDVIHVHANGRVDDRATYLDFVRREFDFLDLKRGELQITMDGSSAIMCGTQESLLRRRGQDGEPLHLSTVVVQSWTLRQGRWQQISFQATHLPAR